MEIKIIKVIKDRKEKEKNIDARKCFEAKLFEAKGGGIYGFKAKTLSRLTF